MRNPVSARRALFAVCALSLALSSAALASCAPSASGQTLSLSDGTQLRWSPAVPKIGDLVSFSADLPRAVNGEPSLIDPALSSIDFLSYDIFPDRITRRWSFRATRAGTWAWKTDGKTQLLWTVESVAGSANDPKTVDANYLWTGKK